MDKKVYYHLSLSKKLRETLKKEAVEKGITLNAYITLILLDRNK